MSEPGASPDAVAISIIIPAYNEAQRLPAAIDTLIGYLDAHSEPTEVLIVENGSSDDTPRLAEEAARRDPRFRALHTTARGKGLAVRTGMLASRGQVSVFCDVDFSMPVEEVADLQKAIADGADVAIASREVPGARRIGEPARRHLMGRIFNWLVRALAVSGIEDTQCGFKAFRQEVARDVFTRSVVDGWAFDVEVLYLARRRGYRIREVPITWRYDPSSRVQPFRDTMAMLHELILIRWNALSGRYS